MVIVVVLVVVVVVVVMSAAAAVYDIMYLVENTDKHESTMTPVG